MNEGEIEGKHNVPRTRRNRIPTLIIKEAGFTRRQHMLRAESGKVG